jgi:predicted DNA-binding transcriptional regulator AlpA
MEAPMPETTRQDNPNIIFGGAELRRRLDVSEMSVWRWVKAGKFPPPDLRINGRRYWRERTYVKWLKDQLVAETARRDRDISTTEDASLEGIDQLGHNGGAPLDDVAKQRDLPVTKVEKNKRGGKNG